MVGLPQLRATYARKERQALCETARSVGPDAPTLCEGWDVKDLVCHLLVRESSVMGAAGIAVSALSGLTDKEMARLKKQPFERLVERLRTHSSPSTRCHRSTPPSTPSSSSSTTRTSGEPGQAGAAATCRTPRSTRCGRG